MSITFWSPEAETRTEEIPCDFPGCEPGNRCGYCQDGVEHRHVSEAPEVEFANVTAKDILGLLDLSTDCYGVIDATVVPMVRASILGAMNLRRMRAPLDRNFSESGGPGTGQCHVFECGNTDDQTMRRLITLDAVLAWAEEHKASVVWG